LPLIGAGAAPLPLLAFSAAITGKSAPIFPIFFSAMMINALYGGAAGMLIRRFGILKALAIPVIPAMILTALSVCAFWPAYLSPPRWWDDYAAFIAALGMPAGGAAWLAFWLHSRWARKHQMNRGPSTENSPDVP